MRRIVCVLFFVCPLLAQDTVFSVSTTLVQVDCVVTNAAGRQVTDLRPEQFEVVVDGKPQAITNFSYIRLDAPAPVAVVKPADVRRSTVLVVDDLSLSFTSMHYVQRALRKFVDEQMQPGDLVALWETGRGNSVFQQFTSDKRVIGAAVDNLHWNPRAFGLADWSERAERGGEDRMVRNGPPETRRAQRAEFSEDLAYARLNTTVGALDTLGELMDQLRTVGGRKTVVFFSDGLFLPGLDVPGEHRQMVDANLMLTYFRRLIDRANRAGVVLYTVDGRGLVAGSPQGGGAGLTLSQEGLIELAERTGGFAGVNGNDFNYYLKRVEEDQSGYYLIGFKAPENIATASGARPEFHSLKVKVNAPGLHAHSRSGFFGETDEASRPKYVTRQAQMMAAVQSLFNKSDVRVKMTAWYRRTRNGRTFVHNLLYIDPRDVTFRTDLFGVHYAALDLYVLASGYEADPLASEGKHITIDVNDEQMKKVMAEGLLLELDVPVKHAGAYQVRASVLDNLSRATGSAGQYIDIPDLKKQRLALTTPVIDDGVAPAENRFNDKAAAVREFRAGSRLAFAFRIEADKGAGNYDTRVQLYREQTPILGDPLKVRASGDGGREVRGELRLSKTLPPGQYYLQATASELASKNPRSASSWIEFELVQ